MYNVQCTMYYVFGVKKCKFLYSLQTSQACSSQNISQTWKIWKMYMMISDPLIKCHLCFLVHIIQQ